MSLSLLFSPNKTVEGIVSNVSAGITQLPYTFGRNDYGNGAGNDNGGFLRLFFTAGVGDVTSEVPIGTVLSFVGTPDVYPIIGTVTANNFLGQTDVTLDVPYTENISAVNINNLSGRPDYTVQIKVFNAVTGLQAIGSTFFYKPSQSGGLFVDLSRIVSTLIESSELNYLNYYIEYRENYNGNDLAYTQSADTLALLSERSIGQAGGSNLWALLMDNGDNILGTNLSFGAGGLLNVSTTQAVASEIAVGDYVTLVGSGAGIYEGVRSNVTDVQATFILLNYPYSVDVNNTFNIVKRAGSFLTYFEETKYWIGFYFGLSFIIDTNVQARTGSGGATFNNIDADINKTPIGVTNTRAFAITPGNEQIREYNILLQSPDSKYIYSQVKSDSGSVPVLVDAIISKVQTPCKNPIMVTWVNSLGAAEYYLFEIKQEVNLGVTGELIYEPAFSGDVETQHRQKVKINADETLGILCTAEKLTQADVRALHEMKTSENVEVFLTKDGSERIGVIIESSSETVYTTDEPLNSFNVILSFPTDYKFFDIVQY